LHLYLFEGSGGRDDVAVTLRVVQETFESLFSACNCFRFRRAEGGASGKVGELNRYILPLREKIAGYVRISLFFLLAMAIPPRHGN